MDGEVSVGEVVAAAAQNTSCLQIRSKQERQWSWADRQEGVKFLDGDERQLAGQRKNSQLTSFTSPQSTWVFFGGAAQIRTL